MEFINKKGKVINLGEIKTQLDEINAILDAKAIDFGHLNHTESLLQKIDADVKALMKSKPNFSNNLQERINLMSDYVNETWNQYIFVCNKDAYITWPKNNNNINFLTKIKDKLDEAFDINYPSSLYQLPLDIKTDFHFFNFPSESFLGIDKDDKKNFKPLAKLFCEIKNYENKIGIDQPFLKKDIVMEK